ncbi:MAG: polyprenyl synthetase family protein [Clostridia bacterium]|nr:polyprenyl synthetase family protein [Clostridia bacterium]
MLSKERFNEIMQAESNLVGCELESLMALEGEKRQHVLTEAMAYSLLAGGKRIRPILTRAFCRACGGDDGLAMPFACALEMIHNFSLIHDDLPCMDDDELRRGRPTNHVVFGEDIAVLAGDGLLNMAFETALKNARTPAHITVEALKILAECTGVYGMLGGQVIDLQSEGKSVDMDTLLTMHRLKTGALIRAAALMGCTVAGASAQQICGAEAYAKGIGLTFQIIDDILDVTSSTEELGKPVGSDAENQKTTFVTLLGVEEARRQAQMHTEAAVEALQAFGGDEFLETLAYSLLNRKK